MSTPLQHRRGNTSTAQSFTGLQGELFVNTDNNQLIVHDGITQGGWGAATTAGYTSGGFLLANTTGVLQNTSPVALVSANNTVIANTNFTITGNLNVIGTTTTVNQEIINTTEVVAGQLTANSGAASTSTTTGALLVTGGAGVTGNLYAGAAIANTVSAGTVAASSMTINSVPVITQTQAILYSLILG
jgi:Major tropism determinant N-terminal domain